MKFTTPYLTLPKPVNYNPSDYTLFKKINDWKKPNENTREIRNVKVFYDGYFFKRFKIDKDSFFGKKNSNVGRMQKLKMFLQKAEKKNIKAIWSVDDWGDGYYHWLVDTLQRYYICTNGKNNTPILLPSTYKNKPFVVDSLKGLEIPVFWVSKNKPIKVQVLLLPPFIKPRGTCNPSYINQLRINLRQMSFVNFKPQKRAIYISRKKAERRKIKNERDVLKIMKKFNVDILCMEDINWMDQMQIMANTDALFSLHGAGLTNMLIMPKGSKILEIRMKTGFNQVCYYELAGALSIDYYYLKADPASLSDSPGNGNCTVKIAELEKVVCQILK